MNTSTTRWAPYLLAILRIATGVLFMQHGAEKLWGFAGGRIDHNFPELHALAGPIELIGGLLITLGLFTRSTAFILCGEMAVAYFRSWAPRGFFPVNNGGEEAVIFCYVYLWIVTSGAGPWSLDGPLEQRRIATPGGALPSVALTTVKQTLASYEPHARSVLRIILAFVFSLHGYRLVYDMFPQLARRAGVARMPLDLLPRFTGYLAIVGGALLLLGLLTRVTALVLSFQALAAYLFIAMPRAPVPLRAGANEVLLYFLTFFYLAAVGGGIWSLDYLIHKLRGSAKLSHAAA